MIDGALIVLQARMASRRCPGKALARIGGRTILARCLDRLRDAWAAPVVLATTTNAEDDVLAALAGRAGVPVVRGPEEDVLRRFVMAAAQFDATYVVRATADNPAVDIDAPRRVLETLLETGADYVAEYGLPLGACVEGMLADALEKADAVATSTDDREHVTPLIRRGRPFHVLQVAAPAPLQCPGLRLTVDTPEDLEFMRRIISSLGNPVAEPPLAAIIDAAAALLASSVAAAS